MQTPDYIGKALYAEFHAEQASTPRLADTWRHIADTYRALAAHQKRVESKVDAVSRRLSRPA